MVQHPNLPPGLRVAPMGRRLNAWLLDSIVFGLFQVGFWVVAVAVGAVAVNPQAEAQMAASPTTLPTVTPYRTNLPLLAALLAVFVVLNVVYATVAWARFRGLPGQRLLSLQVGSVTTGRNLSLGRALIRAVVAVGVPVGALAGLYYILFDMIASVPWADVLDQRPGGPIDAWANVFGVIVLVAVGWPLLLLVWTGSSQTRQGLHDRLAGSLVVADAKMAWTHGIAPLSAYGPGYPGHPGTMGLGPGYLGYPGVPAAGLGDPASGDPASGDPASGDPPLPPAQPAPWPRFTEARPTTESVSDADKPAVHPVTIGRRLAAYLIDAAACFGMWAVAVGVARAFQPTGAMTVDERTYIFIGLAGGLMQLAYFTASVVVWQGSPGQRMLQMRVDDFTTAKGLGWMDSLARWAVVQGPFALCTIVPEGARSIVQAAAFVWAGYLLYATVNSPDGRGPHDRLLNTRVTLDS
jgi:uncharacterized RDD family membrane protein YckC